MIWLVWRRQRLALLVALTLVALVGVVAVVGRLSLVGAAEAAGVLTCRYGPGEPICDSPAASAYILGYESFSALVTVAMIALPGVAGAVAGAGLFGAELSRGTHVFALTQSASRLRWWLTGLLVAGIPVAATLALVTVPVGWALEPLVAIGSDSSPLEPRGFLTTGTVPAAYAVLTFCVAAGAGLLLRSTVGALGLALALQVVVLLTTTTAHPYDYLPPETAHAALPGEGEVDWGTPPDGLTVELGYVDTAGREIPQLDAPLTGCNGTTTFADCLRANGFTALYSRYQPAHHYWPFQAIESGIALGLAALALGAGLVGLRRRVH